MVLGTAGPTSKVGRLAAGAMPPPELPRILVVQTLTYTIGAGFYVSGSVIFFTSYTGLSPAQVASGLSLAALLGLVLQLPFGMLSDRLGGRRTWLIGALGQAVLFGAYPWLHGFGQFLVVICAVAVASGIGGAGRSRYLGEVIPAGRRVAANAYLKSVLNVGFAVGTAGSGFLVGCHSRRVLAVVVLANAVTFLFDAVLLLTCAELGASDRRPREDHPGQQHALADRPFLALAATQVVFALSDTVLTVALPLWTLRCTDAPRAAIPTLLLINMAMAATLQVWASRGSEEIDMAARRQRRAGLFLTAACLLMPVSACSHGVWTWCALSMAVIMLSLGEMFGSAAATGLSYGLSPESRRGEYLAVFGWGSRLAEVVGPAALAFLLLSFAGPGWFVIAVLFAAAGLATTPAVAWAIRSNSALAPLPGPGQVE